MARLTATQIALIQSGQPIRQQWKTVCPVDSAHSGFIDNLIEAGIYPVKSTEDYRRVIDEGSRTYEVFNPHPRASNKPKKLRYQFEVDNRDGHFYKGAGNAWNPLSLYDAEPQECRIKHGLSVYDPATDSWSAIGHMDYEGRVLHVEYVDGQNAAGDIVPVSAIIFTESMTVRGILDRVYNIEDADDELIDDPAGLGDYSFTT